MPWRLDQSEGRNHENGATRGLHPAIPGFLVKAARHTHRAVDRADAAQEPVSPEGNTPKLLITSLRVPVTSAVAAARVRWALEFMLGKRKIAAKHQILVPDLPHFNCRLHRLLLVQSSAAEAAAAINSYQRLVGRRRPVHLQIHAQWTRRGSRRKISEEVGPIANFQSDTNCFPTKTRRAPCAI